MRNILQLAMLIILVFVTGALIAYPVYKSLNILIDIPFHKTISHVTSFSGLVLILCYLRFQKILDYSILGLQTVNRHLQKHLLQGFLFGIVIMLLLESVLYGIGIHVDEPELVFTFNFMVVLFFKAALSSLVVALMEETIYRGALLGALLKSNGVITAITVSSIFYASVHFISYPRIVDPDSINILTGILLLPHIFDGLFDPQIFDAFLSLTAYGVLLSVVRIMTGNIYICMAIHAGTVFAIKFIKEFTDYNHANAYPFLVSSYDHLLGYLAFVWLVFLIILIGSIYQKSRTKYG